MFHQGGKSYYELKSELGDATDIIKITVVSNITCTPSVIHLPSRATTISTMPMCLCLSSGHGDGAHHTGQRA